LTQLKHEPAQIKKLNALIRRLKAKHKNIEAPAYEPTTQLIMAFLQADTTRRKAEQAYDALMEQMVDNNELRVSHTLEIVEVIGGGYLRAHWRVERMLESLRDVYMREHDHKMVKVASQTKKEQRHYLDTLTGVIPYVSASVMLLCFGGHAIPVDDKLVVLLEREGAIDEGLTPAQVESLLLRQFKAGEQSVEAHLLLQAWSDGCKTPASVLEKPEPQLFGVDPSREDQKREPAKKKTPKKPKTVKKAGGAGKVAKKPEAKTTKKSTKKTTKKTAKKAPARTKKK
jgi:endonuclease III